MRTNILIANGICCYALKLVIFHSLFENQIFNTNFNFQVIIAKNLYISNHKMFHSSKEDFHIL